MTHLRCIYCQKPYDALHGHHCVDRSYLQERGNRNNTNFQIIVEKQNDMSQFTSIAAEGQSYLPTLDSTELGNAYPGFSMHTTLTDPAIIDYNLSLEPSNLNSQMVSDNSQMPKTGNLLYQEIANVSGYIDHLVANKYLSDISKGHQQQSNVIKSSSLLRNNQAQENEISGISERELNNESAINISISDDEIARIAIQPTEINRQDLKYEEILEGMVRQCKLDSSTHDLASKKNERNQSLMLSNVPAVNRIHDSDTFNGSPNTRVECQKTELKKLLLATATSDNTSAFNDKIHVRGQKETTSKDNSNTRISESIPSCSVVYGPAVAGPSCSQENENTCPVCHKEFKTIYIMKNHYKKHYGEKRFRCDICKKGFTEKGSLRRHILLHTGEKPHKCDVCGKSFAMKSYLQEHSLTHTGPASSQDIDRTCPLCRKEFKSKNRMKKHYKIHSGERPFTCENCRKGFTRKNHLERHMLIHSGEKTHKCDICGKCFGQKGNLKSHLLTHEGVKSY